MNQPKKVEFIHPIIIWLIASILFHMLLMLGIITLRMHSITFPQPTRHKDLQDHAILMMDEPKQRPIKQPSSMPIQQPQAKKTILPPKAEPKVDLSAYTLIPGRKGINKQKIEELAKSNKLPTPQEQIKEPVAKEEPKTQTMTTETIIAQELIEKDEQDLHQNSNEILDSEEIKSKEIKQNSEEKNAMLPNIPEETVEQTPHPLTSKSKPSDTMFLDESKQQSTTTEKKSKSTFQQPGKKSKNTSSKGTSFNKKSIPGHQDPYQYVPKIQSTISFKDLNLGFDEACQTIGNNRNLINSGTTFAAPEGVALKHITYYNQCAEMMKYAFATHPQSRLRPYSTGKRFRFDLTVDRQGNNLKLTVIQGSDDAMLDKIIEESIKSVTLFPKVPSFIAEDPFTMHWIFLH